MAKHKEKSDYKVGVYVRLSNEDARAGESVSVENQKLMLTKHVQDMGWQLIETYVDDGFTGTNQKRPAFQRMLHDVEKRNINTVLIKDLSRLGRNYLEVGNLAEIFMPEHDCELVSLSEKIDDMMFLRNWFNQQHSSSTSKKVKASKKVCAENGKFMGTYAPFGYKKDPSNRHKLLIDENTAHIARKIFEMRASGMGVRAMAITLNEEGVITPKEYYYQNKETKNPRHTNKLWNYTTIRVILANEAYIGNMVQMQVGTISYKDHRQVSKPKEEWIRADGTHEPLIELELWDRVQALVGKNYRPRKNIDGTTGLFSGLVYCKDCGFKMKWNREKRMPKTGIYYYLSYICGNYARSGKAACSCHGISEKALKQIVIESIRKHAKMVDCNEEHIIEAILASQNSESNAYRASYQSEIKAHQKQVAKLDKIIESLYEDRVNAVVSEDMFKRYVGKYEQERIECLQSLETLDKRVKAIKENSNNATTWARLIKPYSQLENLDVGTILLLIDRIVVGESEIVGKDRICDVQIVYNYVGDIEKITSHTDSGQQFCLWQNQTLKSSIEAFDDFKTSCPKSFGC